MKKKIKVLHLASFEWNIWDNANHSWTRKNFKKYLSFEFEFTNLEIRDFFWKKKFYDNSFAEEVNKYDLFIIWWGNYFELWVESSSTWTSIDISLDILKKIKTPIFFNALWLDPWQWVPKKNIEKFKKFLDYILYNDKNIVSLRNDWAMSTATKYLWEKYSNKMYKIPDGWFFTEVKDYFHPELPIWKKVIWINLAWDMLDIRFNEWDSNNNSKISSKDFVHTFSNLLFELLNSDDSIHLIFIPHIYKDLNFISNFLLNFNDALCRKRITVAPYLHWDWAQEYIFDLYKKCDLIVWNRFHTNVCSIWLNTPSIWFINYIQIENLYKELWIPERSVFVNKKWFEIKLKKLIIDSLNSKTEIAENYKKIKKKLEVDIIKFYKVLDYWLSKNV
jgi:hypothetical protein